jgi:hypothetical protein
MRRAARQLAAVPWVASELRRCRRDVAAVGLTGATRLAEARSRWPLGWLPRRLRADELSGVVLRLAATRTLSSSCLRRALTLWVLLRRGGHDPVLRIGVPYDDPRGEMHAWIELDGLTVGDRPDVTDQFLPFDLSGQLPDDMVGLAG